MLFALLLPFVAASTHQAAPLTVDDLFPRKSWFGKAASSFEWSHGDRYLTYLWNKYDDPGNDLWLYDTQEGKVTRLTSPEFFQTYDRTIPAALERYKKDKADEEKWLKIGDAEYRQWLQDRKKEDEARKEPKPSYAGVSEVEWANKGDEFLMVYKGDVFRWKIGEPKPARLTRTRDAEVQLQYLPDDSGFTFRRANGVYRMRFGGPDIVQLNPELPNGLPLQGYQISPDGSTLMIRTGRSTGPDRQVDYITYRGRFAAAQKTSRGVADDKFNEESYVYLYDLNDDPETNPKADEKPWEVWKWPGGEEWMEVAMNQDPWSKDSKQIVFGSWSRDKKDLEIIVADLSKKERKVVYKTKSDGDHGSPGLADPFFLPDGKVTLLLDTSGYRHAWILDPASGGVTQVTKGDFETYPLGASEDGKTLFVRSGKEHPARMQLYSVNIETGEQKRLSTQTGQYDTPVFGHQKDKLVVPFASWEKRRETYLLDLEPGREKQLTESHPAGFDKVMRIQPKLFSYKNRLGMDVQGYVFLPPGFKKTDKRPLMIYVYGGPLGTGKSVIDGSFQSSGTMFNMLLAQELGFVTVTIDPRGQSGYSNLFGKANWENPGVAQVEDLTDGVKFLTANYGVDPAKVAINGWSFGGFQTQMCMYTAPDVFTLGIAGAGPTEWQNYNTWYTGAVIGDSTPGDPSKLDKFSLTKMAKNLKNPLLLLHGVEDTNVLFQDTIKVYQALLQYGKGPLIELTIDPTGGHGLGGEINTRDRHEMYLDFIKRRWKL
ncbi:MAG: prolyl oligopeptidase family serine peptidase [Fimbriimonas sp.]